RGADVDQDPRRGALQRRHRRRRRRRVPAGRPRGRISQLRRDRASHRHGRRQAGHVPAAGCRHRGGQPRQRRVARGTAGRGRAPASWPGCAARPGSAPTWARVPRCISTTGSSDQPEPPAQVAACSPACRAVYQGGSPVSQSISLAAKTALVTGAATGIGKAIAGALAAAGTRVVVNHPHTPEPAAAVVADIQAAGGSALAVAADISDRAEYQAMVQRLLGEYGRWDVLVNNAAVAVTKPFPQITQEEFDRSFAVNVKGVFHGLQLAWDHLADKGRIITISSSTTALMLPGY